MTSEIVHFSTSSFNPRTMLMIRLSRVGKKKYPLYRMVIQENSRDPWGKALEILGHYNPHNKELVVKKDRIEYWTSVGAQMSVTVNNLLITKQIIKGKKIKATKINKKKKEEKQDGAETKGEPKAELKDSKEEKTT